MSFPTPADLVSSSIGPIQKVTMLFHLVVVVPQIMFLDNVPNLLHWNDCQHIIMTVLTL